MADSAGEKAEVQVVTAPAIEKRILVVRGRQVMLDEKRPMVFTEQGVAMLSGVLRSDRPPRGAENPGCPADS